jgi:hypothetical protein
MTTEIYPYPNRQTNPNAESVLNRYGSANFIVPSENRLFSGNKTELSDFTLNGFEVDVQYQTVNNKTLSLSSGEALIGGRWIAVDTTTTHSLTGDDGDELYLQYDLATESIKPELVSNPSTLSFASRNREYIKIGTLEQDDTNETANIKTTEKRFVPTTESIANDLNDVFHIQTHFPTSEDTLAEDYLPSRQGEAIEKRKIQKSVSANSSVTVSLFNNPISNTDIRVYADIGTETDGTLPIVDKNQVTDKSVRPIDIGTQDPKVELINDSSNDLTITATVIILKV